MRIARMSVVAAGLALMSASAGHADEALRPPSAFSGIADHTERSRALFAESAKVLTSPRCMNCHPAGDHPLQGDDHHRHDPPVERGASGDGIPGAPCAACHTSRTVDLFPGAVAPFRSIPGHPRWELAPREMAWEGKSVGDICRQLKDTKRNSGHELAVIHDHLATDDLVAYGWHPGAGRAPAPGTQQELGEIIQGWIDSGAECP